MASLKHETILTLTGDDLRQTLSDEFCKSYNLLGQLTVTAVRPVDGGNFELTLSPVEAEPKPTTTLQAVS